MIHKFLLRLAAVSIVIWQIQPYAHATNCDDAILELGSEPSVSEDFVRFYEKGYSDSYESSERLENFWGIHQRFGIVKTEDKRILLIAKSEDIAKKLILEMKEAFKSPHEAVSVEPLPEVKDGITYDITKTVAPFVLKFHEEYMANGTNCWNLCLRVARVDHGLHPTIEADFRHWLNSPLAEKVTSSDQLRLGDIIAWVAYDAESKAFTEVHGAVYVAPNLLFSKNGAYEEKPYRLMDIDEVFSMYMSKNPSRRGFSNRFDFYRVRPLKGFMTQHQKIIPQELKEAYETLKERELFLTSLSPLDGAMTRIDGLKAARAFKPVAEKLTAQAREQLSQLENNQTLSADEKKILKTLWQGVIVRVGSLQ